MTTRLPSVLVLAAAWGLAGCPETTESTTSDSPKPAATSKSGTTSTTSTSSANPAPAGGKPAIKARAKEELDGKDPDTDHQGSALVVAGAKYAFTVPTGWTSSAADEVNEALAADDKSRFGATGYQDGDDTGKKADAVAKALELADCTWGSDENISLGKDKVPTKVADGVCMRGKTVVRTIRAVTAGDDAKIVAVGGWDDPGGDDEGVLNSFRSLAPGGSVAACCAAISGNMVTAPAQQKVIYAAALVACQALTNSKEGRDALAQVRGKLPGVPIPPACN